jgi:hypothetical protein
MPKGILLVRSGPASPETEDEYNRWYTEVHIPELLAVPGFVAARRYRLHAAAGSADEGEPASYLAVYEVEGGDLGDVVQLMADRSSAGDIQLSPALGLEPPPTVTLFELLE